MNDKSDIKSVLETIEPLADSEMRNLADLWGVFFWNDATDLRDNRYFTTEEQARDFSRKLSIPSFVLPPSNEQRRYLGLDKPDRTTQEYDDKTKYHNDNLRIDDINFHKNPNKDK